MYIRDSGLLHLASPQRLEEHPKLGPKVEVLSILNLGERLGTMQEELKQ